MTTTEKIAAEMLRLFDEWGATSITDYPFSLNEAQCEAFMTVTGRELTDDEDDQKLLPTVLDEIPARVTIDGDIKKVHFNAVPYFKQASDETLLALAECGWGGDEDADRVAEYMADHNRHVKGLFDVHAVLNDTRRPSDDPIGFECHVDEDKTLEWLARHRPELHDRIVAQGK